jgi:predicted DNA-binding protein (MmcQ/YjbR family)
MGVIGLTVGNAGGMESVRAVASELPEVTEEQPFGEGIPVFKVAGKVFAIWDLDDRPSRVTLKCDPDLALELRAQYAAVTPGYHTNKRLWNTIVLDGTVPDDEVAELIRHAWEQAVASLRKADRDRLLRRPG